MSRSAGSTIARACSGSRSSISSIEPLMSANSAVTVLRSPSAGAASASGSSAAFGMREGLVVLPIAERRGAAPVPRAPSDEPHSPQNFLPAGFAAPHLGQAIGIAVPQSPQNAL